MGNSGSSSEQEEEVEQEVEENNDGLVNRSDLDSEAQSTATPAAAAATTTAAAAIALTDAMSSSSSLSNVNTKRRRRSSSFEDATQTRQDDGEDAEMDDDVGNVQAGGSSTSRSTRGERFTPTKAFKIKDDYVTVRKAKRPKVSPVRPKNYPLLEDDTEEVFFDAFEDEQEEQTDEPKQASNEESRQPIIVVFEERKGEQKKEKPEKRQSALQKAKADATKAIKAQQETKAERLSGGGSGKPCTTPTTAAKTNRRTTTAATPTDDSTAVDSADVEEAAANKEEAGSASVSKEDTKAVTIEKEKDTKRLQTSSKRKSVNDVVNVKFMQVELVDAEPHADDHGDSLQQSEGDSDIATDTKEVDERDGDSDVMERNRTAGRGSPLRLRKGVKDTVLSPKKGDEEPVRESRGRKVIGTGPGQIETTSPKKKGRGGGKEEPPLNEVSDDLVVKTFPKATSDGIEEDGMMHGVKEKEEAAAAAATSATSEGWRVSISSRAKQEAQAAAQLRADERARKLKEQGQGGQTGRGKKRHSMA